MTVIAWDGKALAVDRLLSSGGFVSEVTKLFHINGHAVAICGAWREAAKVVAWFRAGAIPLDYPKPADPNDACWMLAISPTDALMYEGPEPYEVVSPCAWGSGREYAQAAMFMGANAQRAVEVASALSSYCGKGLDVIDLETMQITRVKENG